MIEHAIHKRIGKIQQQEKYHGMDQNRHHLTTTNGR